MKLRKTLGAALGMAMVLNTTAFAAVNLETIPEQMLFENYREGSTYIETCEVGDTVTLTVDVLPEAASQEVVWNIEDPTVGKILSIDGTKITVQALAVGHTKITATAHFGQVTATTLNVIQRSNYEEPYRDQYHFSQNTNWSNDPNGLVYFDGEWHLFFQYNPFSNKHGNLSWGHAVSTDLVHWEELDVALYPDNEVFGNTAPGNEDLGNIFSGSCVVDENNTTGFFDDVPEKKGLVAIFTHASWLKVDDIRAGQSQSIAYSLDKGRTWIKYEGNPVIGSAGYNQIFGEREGDPGDPLEDGAFRDPKVFWHEESDQWMMVVAGGPLRFYSSPDLINWKAEAMQPEIVTECPDLFELSVDGTDETKWVLSEGGRYYRIGDFKEIDGVWTFVTDEDPGNSDVNSELSKDIARYYTNYGADAYAAQTFANGKDGRRVLVQWMSNWSYANRYLFNIFTPYNGQFTLMEELSLKRMADGSLRMQQKPVEEYEMLRGEGIILDGVTITPENNVLDGVTGDVFELKATLTPQEGATEVGFKVLAGDEYETVVKYDIENQMVYTDKSLTGPSSEFVDDKQNGEHWNFYTGKLMYEANSYQEALDTKEEITILPYGMYAEMRDGSIDLHIFVDKCSIETHASDYTALGTCLILPEAGNVNMEAYSVGGDVLADIEVYPLESIWK